MNDVQKIALKSLEAFAEICRKLELRFFLVNGSALGAQKYSGFIPWDDDVDVVMPRRDYEIFLDKAQDMLPEHLFIQNYRTDREFPFLYSKIRNTQTAFIEKSVSALNINHGIYIDIFPLDACCKKQSLIRNLLLKFLFWFSFCSLDDKSKTKIMVRNKILRFFGFHKRTDRALKMIERIVSNKDETSEFCCNYADRQGKGRIPRAWYGDGADAHFEGVEIKIPEKYDDYLSFKYGDWRLDLPEEKKVSHHIAVVCDSNNSYINYFDKNLKRGNYYD